MKFLKYAFIVLFSVSMVSCGSSGGDDVDNVDPGVVITAPTAKQGFVGKDIVTVSFTATDNVALKSYTANVELTKAASVASVKVVPDPFTFTTSGSIKGTTKDVSFPMTLPGNPEKGEYTITIRVADTATEPNENLATRVFVVN